MLVFVSIAEPYLFSAETGGPAPGRLMRRHRRPG